jgi:hypothetical protein
LEPLPDPELIFGHGWPLGEPDFSIGEVVFVGVEGAGALACVLVVGVVVVLCVAVVFCVVGAAAAPAIPAAAPPAVSAPATIVALSSLEMVIESNLLRWLMGVVLAIVRDVGKAAGQVR